MAGTVLLSEHEQIRDWASSRLGFPAVVDVSPAAGTQPMLRLVFDQNAYQDYDRSDRPVNSGGYELVEWDEWFKIFDESDLVLEVMAEQAGVKDSWHRLLGRDEAPEAPPRPSSPQNLGNR